MEGNQFDTIYHEHFSYFSFVTVEKIFARSRPDALRRRGAGDPRRLAAHLRLPRGERRPPVAPARGGAAAAGDRRRASPRLETYAASPSRCKETKRKLLEFLIEAKRAGKTIVGYGAPARATRC